MTSTDRQYAALTPYELKPTLTLPAPLHIPVGREDNGRMPQLRNNLVAFRVGLEEVVHLEEHNLEAA